MKNYRKIIKVIFVSVMIFVFGNLLLMGLSAFSSSKYMTESFEASIDIQMFVFVLACLVISIVELIRIVRNKEYNILPMFGLYGIAFIFSLVVSFGIEVIEGNNDSLVPAIVCAMLTVVFICGAFAIKRNGDKNKKTAVHSQEFPGRFTRFSAEWEWNDVWEDYKKLYLEKMPYSEREAIDDLEIYFDDYLNDNPEVNDKIYVWACNYIAYLFVWLVKHDAIVCEDEAQEEILSLWKKNIYKENPSEYIYNYMDGKVCRNDITPMYLGFLDSYYESEVLVSSGNSHSYTRKISYVKDYDNVVLESMDGGVAHIYCRDFDWEKYSQFEALLEQRFSDWQRNEYVYYEDLVPYEKIGDEGFYSHRLDKNMEVNVQPVEEYEKEKFYQYVDACLAEIDMMSGKVLDEICTSFNAWGESWIEEEKQLTPSTFLERTSPGEIQIYKPYGSELAYNLCFEADFEEEHGIFVTIRGGHVIENGYRMDAESPWSDGMNKKYEEM